MKLNNVFLYQSTSDAYDACMTGEDNVSHGDTLLIPSEGVVGLCETWPVAVTQEAGALHQVEDEVGIRNYQKDSHCDRGTGTVFTPGQIDRAEEVAYFLRYPLQGSSL